MKEFLIFTDGDVDLPSPYDKEVILLPQYYYFDESMIYGDERILSRSEFFEQLRTRRAYTSGVNPALVREKFEDALKDGRIEPYRKSRGMNHALRNIRNIAQSKETARLGVIYVGNTDMFNKCKSLVSSDCEADLNLIVSSHVGPDTTGIAIEWRVYSESDEKA